MATDYGEKYVVGEAPAFIQKIAVALGVAAIDKSTDPGFDTLPDREKRFVKAISENARNIAASAAHILASKEDIDDTTPDATLLTKVNDHWTSLSWMLDSI